MKKSSGRFQNLSLDLRRCDESNRRRRLVDWRSEGTELIGPTGERLHHFGSNDYLGLIAQPIERPIDESPAAFGAGASPLISGWGPEHRRLARSIADLEGTESAVVFSSGFAACCGTVATLARRGDLLLSDALNHASLIDGCRLSLADRHVYRHGDVEQVRSLLERHRGAAADAWIVTDSVFSMDGDVAPLGDLVEVARCYDAEIIVDEAHATGVLGCSGGGLCELLGLADEVAIRIGTLSKAVGLQGGFVAGPQVVIDHMIQNCRTLIFATALAPGLASEAAHRIERLATMGDRRIQLSNRIGQFRNAVGLSSGGIADGVPILPIVLGSDAAAVAASDQLRARGYYVPAIRPPTVPEGSSRLRISFNAAHRAEQVDGLAREISQLDRPSSIWAV